MKRYCTPALVALALASSTAPWAQPAPTVAPSVMLPSFNRQIATRADAVILQPVDRLGQLSFDGTRLEVDADGTILPANADRQLSAVPSGARYLLDVPFKVAVPGVERVDARCELGRIPPGIALPQFNTVAVATASFALGGPSSGTIRIGFLPLDGEGEAVAALIQRREGVAPSGRIVAVCQFSVSGSDRGTAWTSHRSMGSLLFQQNARATTRLVRSADGQPWLPMVTTPTTLIVAMPAGTEN